MIITCGYCRINSAGQHESNCPLYKAHRIYYPNGERLGTEPPDDIVRSLADAYVEIQSIKSKLDEADEELDWWKAHKRRGRSGCACNIEEDGETITEWCAVHAEYKNKLAVAEEAIKELAPRCDCGEVAEWSIGFPGGGSEDFCDKHKPENFDGCHEPIAKESLAIIRVEDKE